MHRLALLRHYIGLSMKSKFVNFALPTFVAMACTPSWGIDLTGHSLELKSRAVKFDVDLEGTSKDFRQTALGLQLDYKSPFVSEKVGFDFTAYQVNKIAESQLQKNEMLPNVEGTSNQVVNSWHQFGQAYIKFKHDDLVSAKIGRQQHDSLLLKSTTSRAVPDTYSGYSFTVKPMDALKVYGAVYDSYLPRRGDKFQKFGTDEYLSGSAGPQKNVIDNVSIYGAQYKLGAIQVDFESLNSKNYLQKYGLVGSYTLPLAASDSLKFSLGRSTTNDDGSLFTCKAEKDMDQTVVGGVCNNHGRGDFLQTDWKTGNWVLTGAVAKFKGLWIEDNFAVNNVSKVGTLTADPGTNFFPTAAVSGNDLTNDGELARLIRVRYDWKNYAPGLITTVGKTIGTGAKNSAAVATPATGKESENQIDVQYAIPYVKGMSFRYVYLKYRADVVKNSGGGAGTIGAINSTESGIFRTDNRIYLDYVHRFF